MANQHEGDKIVAIGKWADEWKATKKAFEAATGKKKPAKTVLGVFRKGSGIESGCKGLDSTFGALKTDNSVKNLAKFEIAIKKYDGQAKNYVKQLEKALKGENDADSAYSKQVDILKKDLQAILAVAEGQLTFNRNLADKSIGMEEKLRRSFLKLLQGTVKKAALFAAQVKADPTPAKFNGGIQKASRDITQNLNNIKIRIDKGDTRWKLKTGDKDYTGLVKIMSAWANDGRRVPAGADQKMVLRELGAFTQAIKGVAEFARQQT